MHKRISDEEKRLRSINAYVVLFVFFIMVAAGIICVMIYNVLSAFGLMTVSYTHLTLPTKLEV